MLLHTPCLVSSILMRGTASIVMVIIFILSFGSWIKSNYFLVFIYSMPGYSVSIKERMLYSSCKNAVVNVLENVYSIQIDKKIEVDSGSELTEEFLMVLISFHF